MATIAVNLWGQLVGALSWDKETMLASFQYSPQFLQSGLEISPLKVPLGSQVFQFPELSDSTTFKGLPGFLADCLLEKFGNRLLDAYLAMHDRHIADLNPLERLCYVGTRGMGALEFQPEKKIYEQDKPIPINISDLADTAQSIFDETPQISADAHESFEALVTVGTSAGGARAKAVIAINDETGDIVSGQGNVPAGYTHWLLKFDDIGHEDHTSSNQVGRIEYAYSEMAYEAGINMMECRLLHDGSSAHFMTQRFDRVDGNTKIHVVTFSAMIHADRNLPGQISYERLFQTIRDLGLPQADLTEMYRRMVFNIFSRNMDDHTKNHAFLMFGDGRWQLAPAYDICFSYKPGNYYTSRHQISCNGKCDAFTLDDLLSAARAADVKNPRQIIKEVQHAISRWPEYAKSADIDYCLTTQIGMLHTVFI